MTTTSVTPSLADLIERGRRHAARQAEQAAKTAAQLRADRTAQLIAMADTWIAERMPSLSALGGGWRINLDEDTRGTVDRIFFDDDSDMWLRFVPGMCWATYDTVVTVGHRCGSCGQWLAQGLVAPRQASEDELLAWVAGSVGTSHPCPCVVVEVDPEVAARIDAADLAMKAHLSVRAANFFDPIYDAKLKEDVEPVDAMFDAMAVLVDVFVAEGLWVLPAPSALDESEVGLTDIRP